MIRIVGQTDRTRNKKIGQQELAFYPEITTPKLGHKLTSHNSFTTTQRQIKLMKVLVKDLDKNGAAFKYLGSECLHISEDKLKAPVFVVLQILELMKDKHFEETLAGVEVKTLFSFKNMNK